MLMSQTIYIQEWTCYCNRPKSAEPSWIMFTGSKHIILPPVIHLTFILKSENSIRLLLIQAMRHFYFFHVRHLVQSATEPRFPSGRIGWLSFSIFARVFSPQLKQHRVLLDNKIGFASMLPRDSELFELFVTPTQSRHFSAVDFVFQPWPQSLSFRHLGR